MAEKKYYGDDIDCISYFLSLKQKYKIQRQRWEERWREAESIFYSDIENLNKIYQGNSSLHIPIMHWKAIGIYSRITRSIFKNQPFFRIDDLQHDKGDKTVVDFHNKYINDYQLDNIEFKKSFKDHILRKVIYGTSVSKVAQEYETEDFSYNEDQESEEIVIKDDTYLNPVLLTEFYSDINKYDIIDSQCCIHSTVVTFESLNSNKKRKEMKEVEVSDGFGGTFFKQESEDVGVYENLELLLLDHGNVTEEQEEYMQYLGLSDSNDKNAYIDKLKEIKKTGYVNIDECYGKYWINGKYVEALITIAEGKVIIRKQETPFKHRRYKRPFIVGRFKKIPSCLYGMSNFNLGAGLNAEYQACRQQAIDARTRSIANMWYEDISKSIKWDYKWRPNGIVKGNGQNGLTPLINPYIGNITNNDSLMIQRDIDQLWYLSPVQEGASDSRMVPGTASGTQQIIAQNDIPLNDLIENTVNEEIKPFLEMLIERNFTFKTPDSLTSVFSKEELQRYGIDKIDTKKFVFTPIVKIIGTYELANEQAQQNGYMAIMNVSERIPILAKRLKWNVMVDRLMRSFGLKDDKWDLLHNEEDVLRAEQAEAQAQAQSQQQQLMMQMQLMEKKRGEDLQDYDAKKSVDAQKEVQKMIAEAQIERSTGQKIA